MNLNSIFSDFCRGLEDVENASKKFAELKTDQDRFEMAYDLSKNFLCNNLNFTQLGKCGIKSKRVRESGNERYNRKSFWESLIFYSESVALAPTGSQEFALASGNRGACLLELDYPAEALRDVKEALAVLPADSPYREKLESRKEKCLLRCKTKRREPAADFGAIPTPPLTKGKSVFFDSASSVVKLEENEVSGRCLTAGERVDAGQVLIVEKPFSSVLLPGRYYSHCSNCLERSVRLVPCESCSASMFCGSTCSERAKLKNHRVECSLLNPLADLRVGKMELLSLRILLDASDQGRNLRDLANEIKNYGRKSFDRYVSSEHETVYKLVGNTEKRTVADLFYRALVACILVTLLEKRTDFYRGADGNLKKLSGGLLLGYMQSLPCNAHEISEFGGNGSVEIGAAVYPTLSLINHSCDPNAVRFSHGDSVVLRAIRPLKAGQEILDNYGYHYATHGLNERRSALSAQYYFRCECEACVFSWPLYENLPDENPRLKPGASEEEYNVSTETFKKYLEAVFQGKCDEDVVRHLCSYLNYLDSNVERPWKPYNKCQEAIKHCLSRRANHFIITNSKEKFS